MARALSRNYKKVAAEFKLTCAEEDRPCWICGQKIDYDALGTDHKNPSRFNLDHYYTWTKYPQFREDPANFRASHAGCNDRRGDKSPQQGLGVLSRHWADI